VRRFGGETLPDFSGCAAVFHLAGESIIGLYTEAKKRRIVESRLIGTRAVVKAIDALPRDGRPDVLVCASGVGYYGETGDHETDETQSAGTGFFAETAKAWEAEAEQAAAVCRVVRARIAMVLGTGGGAMRLLGPVFKAGAGAVLGDGRQWMSWIHLDDAAALLLRAFETDAISGALNVVAPWPVKNREFTRTMGRVLSRPTVLPAPAFALRLLFREFAEELLGSRRVVPQKALDAGYQFLFPELEPALRRIFHGL
jgi:uncharacterized protein (TIGR01777 family)